LQTNVRIALQGSSITAVECAAQLEAGDESCRLLVPALANLHSHAFQRLLAGLAEFTDGHADDFWTWREAMFQVASHLDPTALYEVAVQLYGEMLAAGYSHVAEFHYLHQPHPLEMCQALTQAARDTGIGITLLPCLYQRGGFDGSALRAGQKLFYLQEQDFMDLLNALQPFTDEKTRLGWAPHSLRAVEPALLQRLSQQLSGWVCHMHVAEQRREVQDCLAATSRRPVEWVLENLPIGVHTCLVHATHVSAEETTALAASQACVSLNPSTEGNLGDGLFPLTSFLAAGGRFGIGTDSQSSISPVEELRWLEYGQRLKEGRRNVAAGLRGESALTLLEHCWASATAVLDRRIGRIQAGFCADLLELDDQHPLLIHHPRPLSAWLFSGNATLVRRTMVAGIWRASAGEAHFTRREAFAALLSRLYARL
jgi:formimidoylglutamate deiminase